MFDRDSFLAGLTVGRVLWNLAKGGIYGRTTEPAQSAETQEEDNSEETNAV